MKKLKLEKFTVCKLNNYKLITGGTSVPVPSIDSVTNTDNDIDILYDKNTIPIGPSQTKSEIDF